MTQLVQWIDKHFYQNYQNNWDDLLFRDRVLNIIQPTFKILDLGAGAGIVSQMNFKGLVQKVCGVDLDPRVVNNPFLDEGKLSDAAAIPYDDETFDLVFADNVLEHLADPQLAFNEISRVLKNGGYFLFKTPNKWHYMPTIARFTPHSFHRFVNNWRGRIAEDVFPTLYRANSNGSVLRLAHAADFELTKLEHIEGRPEYLRVSTPTYIVGLIYERFVNSANILASLRILLIGTLRKPE